MAVFKIKLLRATESKDDIPVINEDHFIGDPTVARLDYAETINDIKVQYVKFIWFTQVRITQEVVETLRQGLPYARLTQDVIEYIHHGVPYARLTQDVIEVLGEYSISSSSSSLSSSSLSSSSSSLSSSSSSSSSRSSSSSSSSSSSLSSSSVSSSSRSSSSSSSYSMVPSEWTWGHDTGVVESNVENLSDGSGTAEIMGSGDSEAICIYTGEYWILPAKNTGNVDVEITYDQYAVGFGSGTIEYRTGATKVACEAASWNTYSSYFTSLGWVQIKVSI